MQHYRSIPLVTPPYAEPIHLDEAKDHLRIERERKEEDEPIKGYIIAARKQAEAFLGAALVAQTYDLILDSFSYCYNIKISRPPLLSVVHVKYVDVDGTVQTLATTEYTVDANSRPGLIYPAYGKTWPSTRDMPSAVTVRFIAGYVTPFTVTDVPNNVITPKGGRTYANGDVLRLTNSGGALPDPLKVETDYYVVNVSGATFKLALTAGGAAIDLTNGGSGISYIGELPADIKMGILVTVAQFFENRTETDEGIPGMPTAAKMLMWSERCVPV